MKKNLHLIIALPVFFVALSAYGSEINLGGKKDLVLAKEVRGQVLNMSENLLADSEDDFVKNIAGMENPFVFDQIEEMVIEKEEEADPVINYDDASILGVVAGKFSQQVRGTLIRGDTSFLQLEGGALIRPGASFPVSIPQAQGRNFTVTVSQITDDSYSLRLGGAERVIRLNGTSEEGSGAFRSN